MHTCQRDGFMNTCQRDGFINTCQREGFINTFQRNGFIKILSRMCKNGNKHLINFVKIFFHKLNFHFSKTYKFFGPYMLIFLSDFQPNVGYYFYGISTPISVFLYMFNFSIFVLFSDLSTPTLIFSAFKSLKKIFLGLSTRLSVFK